jgi:uncharacterized protein with PIN domain
MSKQINIRFYRELNDFLPADQHNADVSYELKAPRSIKDFIESIGVPHTEIDLIIINGKSVDFNYLLQHGDHIHVHPVNASLALSPLKHCQPAALPYHRFVLDVHLGRLAAYLRMSGFDTLYRNDYDDPTLATISANENRILLTCDRLLLMRKQVTYGYFVRARQPHQQLLEVLSRFDLHDKLKPFSRCMHCNGKTRVVSKKEIQEQLLTDTKKYYSEFFQCETCNKIYWKGSHYQKMKAMIDKINTTTVSTSS